MFVAVEQVGSPLCTDRIVLGFVVSHATTVVMVLRIVVVMIDDKSTERQREGEREHSDERNAERRSDQGFCERSHGGIMAQVVEGGQFDAIGSAASPPTPLLPAPPPSQERGAPSLPFRYGAPPQEEARPPATRPRWEPCSLPPRSVGEGRGGGC